MKFIKAFTVLTVILTYSSIVNAQVPASTPPPRVREHPWVIKTLTDFERERQLRELDGRSSDTVVNNRRILTKVAVPKITDKGKKIVFVEPELKNRYKEFLKASDTGLIKLFPSLCEVFLYNESVNLSSDNEGCFGGLIPGGGSSFSFRTKLHTLKILSDIELNNEKFNLTGQLIQGFLVSLGDLPIESIKPDHKALNYIVRFNPGSEKSTAINQNIELQNGLKDGEFYYATSLDVKTDTTYLLRSSAYRVEAKDAIPAFGYYHGMLIARDNRKDVIIAFRVVEKNSDGSVTLLWKEFSRKDSVKLNL